MNRRDAVRALLATLVASPGVQPYPAHGQPRALGVKIPQSVLVRADRVIE